MEIIIQTLMLFILLATAMKLSLSKGYMPWCWGLVYAAFVVLSYPYSIEQTKPGIEAYISIRSLRENTAILITLEAVLFITYCFLRLGGYAQRGVEHRSWYSRLGYALLHIYPGLLLLPVLFYTQTSLIFMLTGVDFALTSYSLALLTAVGIPLLSFGLARLIPEEELRLEVLFLVAFVVFVLGLITTVEEKMNYSPAEVEFSSVGILIALGIFTLCFIVGCNAWRIRHYFSLKTSKHK